MKLKKKYLYLSFIFWLPFLLFNKHLISITHQSLISPEYTTKVISDKTNNGNSEVRKETMKNGYSFSYTLHQGYVFPYTGLQISKKDASYINLSKVDALILTIKTKHSKYLPIILNGDMNVNSPNPEHYLETKIDVSSSFQTIIIPLTEFTTPDWWLDERDMKKDEKRIIDLSKIEHINIQSGQRIGTEKNDLVQITSFQTRSSSYWLLYLVITLASIHLTLILLNVFSNQRKKIEIKFAPTAHSIPFDNGDKIISFITDHYMEENISINLISKELAINTSKITEQIKLTTGFTFKQFLNKLRIEEAKRLLANTDLRSSEIAFKVGYGNVSHFNRVFKEKVNVSPNEYRESETKLS